MHTITIGQQSTLAGEARPIRRNVFDRPVEDLRALVEAAQVECYECGAKGRVGRRMLAVEVYNEPWQEAPDTIHVCREVFGPAADGFGDYGRSCYDLLTDTGWADFRYFECGECSRMVIRQCPRNGWHSYVREVEDEEVCLKCYEESIFADGLPRDGFEEGRISGMFCDKGELTEHGFALVDGFEDCYISDQESSRRFCDKALALIDAGHAVAVDYERMAIGGSEGYVSLYSRPPKVEEESGGHTFLGIHSPEAWPPKEGS